MSSSTTSGIKETVFEAVQACRNGGKVVAMGYVDPVLEIPSYEIVIKEKQVVGSRALTRAEFREVVGLVNSGQLDPDIGELIPIRQINEALENLRNGRYLTRSVLMLPFGRPMRISTWRRQKRGAGTTGGG